MLRLYASLISCLLALGCSSEHSIQVEGAWVGKILPTQSVTAGYMRITNTGHIDARRSLVERARHEDGTSPGQWRCALHARFPIRLLADERRAAI